MLVTHQVSIA